MATQGSMKSQRRGPMLIGCPTRRPRNLPASAQASPLLSGYGGPGQGTQAILGGSAGQRPIWRRRRLGRRRIAVRPRLLGAGRGPRRPPPRRRAPVRRRPSGSGGTAGHDPARERPRRSPRGLPAPRWRRVPCTPAGHPICPLVRIQCQKGRRAVFRSARPVDHRPAGGVSGAVRADRDAAGHAAPGRGLLRGAVVPMSNWARGLKGCCRAPETNHMRLTRPHPSRAAS